MCEADIFYYDDKGNLQGEEKIEGINRIIQDGRFNYFNFTKWGKEYAEFELPGGFSIDCISFGHLIEPEYYF